MQRSDELAILSREHHVALELALRLQRATDDGAVALARVALHFWEAEGREHFRLEEELLLPAFARHARADDPDVVRVLVEHVDIRRRMADLARAAEPNVVDLHGLGVALRDHVRHEERVLFGRIEQALGAEELTALGVALRHDSASA